MRTTARPFGPVARVFLAGRTLLEATTCSCFPDSLVVTLPSALTTSMASPAAKQEPAMAIPNRQKMSPLLNLALHMPHLTYALPMTVHPEHLEHGCVAHLDWDQL